MALALAALAGVGVAQTIQDERRALAKAKADGAAADARALTLQRAALSEQGEAKKAQAEAAAVAARIQSAEAGIAAGEARVRLVERMQGEVKARLAAKQQPSVRLVAALQTLARRPPLLALAQPGSISDMVHVRAVMAHLLPEVQRRTAGLRADLDRGRQLRADADKALAALAAGRERLAKERLALTALAARHRQQGLAFAGSADAEMERALGMGERARDLTELIGQLDTDAEVRDRLAALPGPVIRPGSPTAPRSLPGGAAPAPASNRLPYRLPVAGSVVSGLGEVSATGIRARGLTLAVRPQAQVVAPAEGRIVFAGPFKGFDRIVIVDHGQGWTSLITGLAALDVQVGASVVQGGPIGRAGTERPQVMVELRRNMRPIDIAWLVG